METMRQENGTVVLSGKMQTSEEVEMVIEQINNAIRYGYKIHLVVDTNIPDPKEIWQSIFTIHTS